MVGGAIPPSMYILNAAWSCEILSMSSVMILQMKSELKKYHDYQAPQKYCSLQTFCGKILRLHDYQLTSQYVPTIHAIFLSCVAEHTIQMFHFFHQTGLYHYHEFHFCYGETRITHFDFSTWEKCFFFLPKGV